MSLKVHETLLNNSSTAMSNLFAVNFSLDSDNSHNLSFRLTGNVTLPQISRATVDLSYKDTTIKKAAPGFSISKDIQFSFRVDENYELYKFLLENLYEEKSLMSTKDSGSIPKEIPYVDIELSLLGGIHNSGDLSKLLAVIDPNPSEGESYSDSTNKLWNIKFNDCRLTSLSGITFGYDNSSPITVIATFIFTSISLL